MPTGQALLLLILLVGLILIVAVFIRSGLQRLGLPAIIGYISLGLVLRSADQTWQLFSAGDQEVLAFLADLGVICLLFRVGLESELAKLLDQLRRASVVWISNIVVSGLVGFITATWFLNLDLVPSLFVSTAMTATSVSISVAVWQEANALNSQNGELMLDVAEMDDLSAIAIMALLFALIPVLQNNPEANWMPVLTKAGTVFIVKSIFFGTLCFLFSRYVEQRLTSFFQRLEPSADPTIMVAGVGFMIAALAGLLGFSVAIGAFFAGLAYSYDPRSVKIDASFGTLYELFVPFFFIGIGLSLELSVLPIALGWGSILLIAAVAGKVVGVAVAVVMLDQWKSATLLGISMVPQAEIIETVKPSVFILPSSKVRRAERFDISKPGKPISSAIIELLTRGAINLSKNVSFLTEVPVKPREFKSLNCRVGRIRTV